MISSNNHKVKKNMPCILINRQSQINFVSYKVKAFHPQCTHQKTDAPASAFRSHFLSAYRWVTSQGDVTFVGKEVKAELPTLKSRT